MTNNLKPFDLERALAGDKVVTRDGREITEIFVFKTAINTVTNIVMVIDGQIHAYSKSGNYCIIDQKENDLFMVTKTKKLWMAICKDKSEYDNRYNNTWCYETLDGLKEELKSMYADNYIIKEIEIEV